MAPSERRPKPNEMSWKFCSFHSKRAGEWIDPIEAEEPLFAWDWLPDRLAGGERMRSGFMFYRQLLISFFPAWFAKWTLCGLEMLWTCRKRRLKLSKSLIPRKRNPLWSIMASVVLSLKLKWPRVRLNSELRWRIVKFPKSVHKVYGWLFMNVWT